MKKVLLHMEKIIKWITDSQGEWVSEWKVEGELKNKHECGRIKPWGKIWYKGAHLRYIWGKVILSLV